MTGQPDDRTMQVPVSLPTREQIAAIEALRHAADRDRPFGMTALVTLNDLDAVLALLSQPTPTAELEGPVYRCTECGRMLEDSHTPTCTWFDPPARPFPEPPRIEDMAPGTRCREDVPGTVPSWAGEDQIDPCSCVLATGHDGRHQCSHQVDPSTIRDVTPPKEA